jgi:hypothetical protein
MTVAGSFRLNPDIRDFSNSSEVQTVINDVSNRINNWKDFTGDSLRADRAELSRLREELRKQINIVEDMHATLYRIGETVGTAGKKSFFHKGGVGNEETAEEFTSRRQQQQYVSSINYDQMADKTEVESRKMFDLKKRIEVLASNINQHNNTSTKGITEISKQLSKIKHILKDYHNSV